MTDATATPGDAKFGEAPLAQTVAAAGAIRRLGSLLLSLEHAHPTVDTMLAKFAEWESELAAAAPRDSAPRIGAIPDDPRRIYLNHATDIGAYNPCFPEYRFDHLDAEKAVGRVTFPLVYEGPPGLVHGGFLGVFFDCRDTASQLCDRPIRQDAIADRDLPPADAVADRDCGSTSRARRSTGAITSTARLLLDDEVLCTGEVSTVASPPEKLSVFQFARRRKESAT